MHTCLVDFPNWLKSPFAVIGVRSVGAISSVLAATIAIFADAEGVKSRATVAGQIRLKGLVREAWNDRFVRRVFAFIVISNLIFLFGDYLKDEATNDSNKDTSAEIVRRNQAATEQSGISIVANVKLKTDKLYQQQQDISQTTQTALDSIHQSQNAFYFTWTDLEREWQQRQGMPYPKICQILNKLDLDPLKPRPHSASSTDPDVAQLSETQESMNDDAVISDLKKLDVSVWVADKGQRSKWGERDRIIWARFVFPGIVRSSREDSVYEVTEAGMNGAGSEISFRARAPDGCTEHLSLYSDALSDDFPDNSIPELAGKTLVVRNENASPWTVSDINFGDKKMWIEYPTSRKPDSRDTARLKENRNSAGKGYEFEFPNDWKDLTMLFVDRPHKKLISEGP